MSVFEFFEDCRVREGHYDVLGPGPDTALDPERLSEVSQIEVPHNADQLSSNSEFESMPVGIVDDSDRLGFGHCALPSTAPASAPLMGAANPVDCLLGVFSYGET
ncbi:hypothetical protein WSS_A00405 [Rhodococcus opacus M213]|uniref:Uncharacterized protein n=1 Tax=Rhodococcus opacus M213 TaxID=1129896 RepID=K8XTF0_RHOOP|nr:hypothetical protein WSS_A00405 [Rhodococcus opacus M213]